MLINNLHAIKKLQEGKFIRQLKKYLNELVSPSPNLPDDDIFDEKTKQAILKFKNQSAAKGLIISNTYVGNMKGLPDIYTWATIGRVLGKQKKLRKEIESIIDNELKSLLIGMDIYSKTIEYYTNEMELCDTKISNELGGNNAIAAANGFEPEGLAVQCIEYGILSNFYKGDMYSINEDGTLNTNKLIYGHLSTNIMHLYGSIDGTRLGVDGRTYTDIFIPDGFERKEKAITQKPGAEQALVHFYYKKNFGNLDNVTILLMHVKDFKPIKQGSRWKIGQIGGKGGGTEPSNPLPYIHSHFVLLKGDVGSAIKVDNKGKFDYNKTLDFRVSIGIKFKEAFC